MEARAVLERLGEPQEAQVTGHQLHAIQGKQVAVCTLHFSELGVAFWIGNVR